MHVELSYRHAPQDTWLARAACATFHGEASVNAEPFDAIALELAILWAR